MPARMGQTAGPRRGRGNSHSVTEAARNANKAAPPIMQATTKRRFLRKIHAFIGSRHLHDHPLLDGDAAVHAAGEIEIVGGDDGREA